MPKSRDNLTSLYRGAWIIPPHVNYRASGWNSFYRPGVGYVPIYRKGTDQPYYALSDLNALLL